MYDSWFANACALCMRVRSKAEGEKGLWQENPTSQMRRARRATPSAAQNTSGNMESVCGTKDSFPLREHKVTDCSLVEKILLSTCSWPHQATYLTHLLVQYLLFTFTTLLLRPAKRKGVKKIIMLLLLISHTQNTSEKVWPTWGIIPERIRKIYRRQVF